MNAERTSVLVVGAGLAGAATGLTPERATELIRFALDDPTVEPKILAIAPQEMAAPADRRHGR